MRVFSQNLTGIVYLQGYFQVAPLSIHRLTHYSEGLWCWVDTQQLGPGLP